MEFKVTPNHVLGLLAVAVLSAAIYFGGKPSPAPAPAPAPPAPVVPFAPPHTCPALKPFNVACPYCRNVLSVQPRDTGAVVGKVTGEAAGK